MVWNPELEKRLKRPGDARLLIQVLEHDPAASYDLLFYSSFADKLLGVMRQAGPDTEGFARMQQTFGEAVEKVRAAIVLATQFGFGQEANYTELSPEAMQRLIELMHDLAIIKHSEQ